MARLARIVIPGVAHPVTQRGNRRLPMPFSDDDRGLYLALLAEAARAAGTACLALRRGTFLDPSGATFRGGVVSGDHI